MEKKWIEPEMETLEISQTAGGWGHGGNGKHDGDNRPHPGFDWEHGGCGNGFINGDMEFSM